MSAKDDIDIRRLTLKKGLSWPNDRELIMLILGTGSRNMPVECMAERIIKVLCGYNPSQWVEKMCAIEGVGASKALAIAAAMELGRRYNRNPQAVVNTPKDVIPFIKHYSMQSAEHFVCVTINGAREIISIRVLCVGSGNKVLLKPSEIFSEALIEHASGIVLCHNHPGGKAEPSNEDIKTTAVLEEAASLLGLALVDHLIITRNSYFSFLENGLLKCTE